MSDSMYYPGNKIRRHEPSAQNATPTDTLNRHTGKDKQTGLHHPVTTGENPFSPRKKFRFNPWMN